MNILISYYIIMDNKRKEIKQHIVGYISDYEGTEAEELHHNLFNASPYIIGTYEAAKWLEDGQNLGTFDALGMIQEYEMETFDKVRTNLSNPEQVASMLAYILGEQVLGNTDIVLEGELTPELINKIKKKLQ